MNRSNRLAGLSVAAIAAGLLLALIVPGIASASARPLTFEIYIGDTCVSGTAGDNAMVALTWKAAIGSIKATTHVQANSYDGRWVYCTTGSPVVQIGDVIKATVGTATRRFVVPELGVVQNRTKESYHGRGPAGDYLGISCPYNFYVVEPCQPFYPWRVRVSSYGRWSLPNREVIGGDLVSVRWTSPHGDRVFAHSTAPYIAVTIGRAAFTGFVNGTSVRVDLRDGASDAVLASGAASRGEDGSFAGEFRDANGHKFNVSVGDRVVADIATDVNFNVFAMDARADSTTDEITGHCPFDAYSEGALSGGFEFDIYRNGVWRDGGNDALADDGSFDYNVTFKSTDRILVGCQLTTGDFVQVWATMQ